MSNQTAKRQWARAGRRPKGDKPAIWLRRGYRTPPPPPYSLVCVFTHGDELTLAQGHNPAIVREAHDRVARNPKVIASIELRDNTGILETIWRNTWVS